MDADFPSDNLPFGESSSGLDGKPILRNRGRAESVNRSGLTKADSDFCSWIMLNGDLLPNHGASNSRSYQSPLSPYRGSRDTDVDDLLSLDPSGWECGTGSDVPHLQQPRRSFSRQDTAESGATAHSHAPSGIASVKSGSTKAAKTPKDKKREDRLIRNREIARNCRKRKREKFEALQAEVKKLKERNRHLELKLVQFQKKRTQAVGVKQLVEPAEVKPPEPDNVVTGEESCEEDARITEFREIARLLKEHEKLVDTLSKARSKGPVQSSSGTVLPVKDEPLEGPENRSLMPASGSVAVNPALQEIEEQLRENEKQLSVKIGICKDLHSDFGRERENEIMYHMKLLENLLVPNQLSKLTLWSLQQEDDFYDEATNAKKYGGGLWNTLCAEFKLTKGQKAGLMNMRTAIRQQRNNIAACLKIMKELEGRVTTNFQTLKQQMKEIMTLTTPTQQAKFLMWIERNQPCMYILNNLWDKERAQVEKKVQESVSTDALSRTSESTTSNAEVKPELLLDLEPKADVSVSKEEMEEALKSTKTLMAMRALISKTAHVSPE